MARYFSKQWLHPLQCLQYMMDLRAGTAQSSVVSVKAAMCQWLHSRLVAAIVGTDGTGSRCRAKDHRATQCRTTTFNKICSLVHKKKKEEKTPRWEKKLQTEAVVIMISVSSVAPCLQITVILRKEKWFIPSQQSQRPAADWQNKR